uniref:Translational activator of cytochrome c oxidase I n=1 Tax=Terrapene triunguis TaxID=2587831 RepID=A0A674IAT1_9SAUR
CSTLVAVSIKRGAAQSLGFRRPEVTDNGVRTPGFYPWLWEGIGGWWVIAMGAGNQDCLEWDHSHVSLMTPPFCPIAEGGPNPDLNTNLANIIEQCRSKSMPKASIEVAIKGGDKGKSSSYLLYEARGPGGSALLIEVLTDNAKRAYQDVRLILSRNGAQMSDGARHSFDKKGVITVSGQDSQQRPVALEQALELAIEAGAQDVWEEDDDEERAVLKFVCEVPSLHQVREKLDSLGLQSLSAALEFIPNARVRLSDEEMERASQLLATLGDCQEVIRVYDNIE